MATFTALAPDRRSFVAKKKFAGQITVRKDVRDMSAQDVSDFRHAIWQMAQYSVQVHGDNRGFQFWADYHGITKFLCQHGTPGFALWHRPYMQHFEQTMQDIVPGIFLPYWDWTSETQIPQIFLDPTWVNPTNGQTEPNPLLGQPMNGGPVTHRNHGSQAQIDALGPQVAAALLDQTYDSFSPDLENPHGGLHVWVGGEMGSVPTAAYDPLFYAHHSFVEKVFCDWQDAHPGASQPNDVPTSMLVPWGVTVDDIWNYKQLGYVYKPYSPAPLTLTGAITEVPTATNSADAAVLSRPTLQSGQTVTTFTIGYIDPEFHRAEIRFEGLTPPEDSFDVRVFINEPKADAKTQTDGNNNFLGVQHFFGHGQCFGAEGHCEPQPRDIYDTRPRHHYDQIRVRLNVTRPLRVLVNAGEKFKDAPVTLVVVDPKGTEIKESGLYFEGFSLSIS